MKRLSSLIDFFYEEIYPNLEYLETKRKRIYFRLKVVGIIILIFTVSFYIFTKEFHIDIFLYLFIPISIFLFIYKMETKDFYKEFKGEVISKLVNFIDTSLDYKCNSYVQQYEYRKSLLFTNNIDIYTGSDLVSGKIGDINIKFSQIVVEKEKDKENKQIKNKIFQGLFFIADFNKNFNGITILHPDSIEKLFGNFAYILQSLSSNGLQLVKMDNPEFEKEFVIYSSNQIEARYILTQSFMENLLRYKKRLNKPLHVSFINSKIYIAVNFNKELFIPKIYKNISNLKDIKEYFELISFMINIVDELKLNRKIWMKQ